MKDPRWFAAAAVLALVLTGCGSGDEATEPSTAPPSAPKSPSAQASTVPPVPDLAVAADVATGLEVPWGIAALPSGGALVSERISGRVLRVEADGTTTSLGQVPGVRARGEGGLLGLAVDPADPNAFFAYFTSGSDNRVVRVQLADDRLGAVEPVLTGIPSDSIHNGGRLLIGREGFLYVATGDAGDGNLAQDTRSLAGKILRLNLDGSVPADNPFGNPVWSYGHRNVQGLAFDSAGRLWASEFGSKLADELNLIERGGNYGWPVVEGTADGFRDFIDPQVTWPTDEASPSGLVIVDDVAYLAALRGQRLWQVQLTDGVAGTPRAWLEDELGRLRTLAVLSDGQVWLSTSNRDGRGDPRDGDDRIVRLSLT
jgi:glucose/arabinose dehydrogenase